jgi:hypothetical protein
LGSFQPTGVADPTLAQDAATKNYVDTALNSSNVLAQMYLWETLTVSCSSSIIWRRCTTNAGVVTIETDAVTTAKILDGTILAADIATDAVTTAKILDGTILAADIANAAVTNAKLDKANIPLSGFVQQQQM